MKRLNDDEIEVIWDNAEKQRFEHPDADKPDFQLFDPLEYGKLVARAAEDERDRQWIEWIEVNGFAQMVDTLPLDKGDVIIPADKWQSLWQQVEEEK